MNSFIQLDELGEMEWVLLDRQITSKCHVNVLSHKEGEILQAHDIMESIMNIKSHNIKAHDMMEMVCW